MSLKKKPTSVDSRLNFIQTDQKICEKTGAEDFDFSDTCDLPNWHQNVDFSSIYHHNCDVLMHGNGVFVCLFAFLLCFASLGDFYFFFFIFFSEGQTHISRVLSPLQQSNKIKI